MSPQNTHPEMRRLSILQAMGISSWYPRKRLPGAAASQLCEGFEQAPETVAPAEYAPRIAQFVPDESATQEKIAPAIAPAEVEPPPVAAADTAATAAAEPVPVLQFQLLFMPVDSDLALLCQVPALGASQLQKKQRQLLANILRWLGRDLPASSTPRVFRWPLPGLPVNNTHGAAGASLQHFLEQAALEQPSRFLLVLGEHAVDCLQAHAEDADAKKRQALSWHIVGTHSLDEMLALPQLKRTAWQSLLPVHSALHSPATS